MFLLPDVLVPKRKHFGLAIGRASLRAVEVDKKGKISVAVESLVPDGVFNEGVLVNKEIFVTEIKKLVTQGKFTTSYVTVCFSEIYAFSRDFSLPVLPPEEIHEAVSWKVKDLFPFPESEIYYDWKLLETTDKEHQLVVVAVPKKILDPLIEALQSAGLKPLSFEPGATAITRLLVLKAHEQAVLTEINRKGAYVTFVEGEKPLFTTVVNFSNEDTPEGYLKNIKQTIVDIVNFYKRKGVMKTEAVPIVLSGEMISEDWVKWIAANLSYPVKILKSPVPNPAFNKAYSAAVAAIAPPRDPQSVNLLPESLQKLYDHERSTSFFQSILLKTLLVVGILLIGSISTFLAVSFEKQRVEGQVKTLTQRHTQKTDNQNLLILNSQAQNIVALAPLRATPKDKLLVILSILPERINVTQWEYDDSKLAFTFIGIAADRSDLLNFKKKLEQTDEFTKVTLPLGSLESPINVRFSISFVSKK